MALLFVDGFDHYAVAYGDNPKAGFLTKWTNYAERQDRGSAPYIAVGAGRKTNALYLPGGDYGNATLSKSLGQNVSTIILGCAFYLTSLGADKTLCYFFDSAGGAQARVGIRANRAIFIERPGTVLAQSSYTLPVSTWVYLEIKCKPASSGGIFEVRVDQQVVATFSGNTQATGNANISTFTLYSFDGFIDWKMDDLYICDGTGAVNNDYLGDISVSTLFPNGNGATSGFSQTGGSGGHYTAVNEAAPDGDTSYLSTSVVSTTETMTYTDLAANVAAVKGVAVNMWARKDDAGLRTIAAVARPTTTDQAGSSKTLSTSFTNSQHIWDTNPDTATPWSASDVNGSEFGVKLTG